MSAQTTPKQDRLVHLAMRFYREAEAPSEGMWAALFYAIARGDEETLRSILKQHNVE